MSSHGPGHSHGSSSSSASSSSHGHGHGSGGKKAEEKKKDPPAWPIFVKSVPYLWPRDSAWLRFCFVLSIVCLVIGSLADLYTPIATKHAVDELSGNVEEDIDPVLPTRWILIYGAVRFCANVFQQLRDVFFAAVGAETERRVALETFNHLQSLSLSFHLKRETGAVLRSVSRGSQSFATLARIVLFQIAPIFLQLLVVCVYLASLYPWYFSFLTFVIIAAYFLFTFTTTNWRDRYRRRMNEADNEYNQKAVDALLNVSTAGTALSRAVGADGLLLCTAVAHFALSLCVFLQFETVKYFNAERHEERRYDSALTAYTVANTRTQQSLAILNAGQNFIISAGITLALYLAARQVLNNEMTVGDWIMVQAFILQLYTPLGFLGTFYRMIKQNIVDVESMFKLLAEAKDVADPPDAAPLVVSRAEIRFDHVSFSYDRSVPILRNISFTVQPGQKVAIVGQSGAGKSTIARLLYRFYDVSSGRILIDGQDISRCTQVSLRSAICIIPQDTVLFNDTLRYNIGYGAVARLGGQAAEPTQAEVEQAAEAASLTAFIQRQPDGYETKVGERGLRLSGGEKQRVSIARAILKRSPIMIMDEATSALDSGTEVEIQKELDAVSTGRSSITIAHRLSTIANSDLIIVLERGGIAEQGTHQQLLDRGGLYAAMWHRQERARQLKGELEELTAEEEGAGKKVQLELVPEGKEEQTEAEGKEEPMFGRGEDDEKKAMAAAGEEDSGSVLLDVRDEASLLEGEDAEDDSDGTKRKKKRKGGKSGDLSTPLLE